MIGRPDHDLGQGDASRQGDDMRDKVRNILGVQVFDLGQPLGQPPAGDGIAMIEKSGADGPRLNHRNATGSGGRIPDAVIPKRR